jgi:hypothetical protein
MTKKPNQFKPIRKRVLKYWLDKSKRNRTKADTSDNFIDALECKWQNNSDHSHVSLFCGIGEWTNHITDALLDESCDNLRFNSNIEGEQRRLFRFYCRIMFAIAETLNDFEESLSYAYKKSYSANIKINEIVETKISCKKIKVRELLGDSVDTFQDFVNRVVKHKSNNIFKADHHLPIAFEDRESPSDKKLISMTSNLRNITSSDNYDAILAPKLKTLIDILLDSYCKFDSVINQTDDFFKLICEPYSEDIPE